MTGETEKRPRWRVCNRKGRKPRSWMWSHGSRRAALASTIVERELEEYFSLISSLHHCIVFTSNLSHGWTVANTLMPLLTKQRTIKTRTVRVKFSHGRLPSFLCDQIREIWHNSSRCDSLQRLVRVSHPVVFFPCCFCIRLDFYIHFSVNPPLSITRYIVCL